MIPEAYLIASTNVDWIKYLRESNNILARSLTASLDKRQITADGLGSFIGTLSELGHPGSDPIKAIRYSAHLLEHIMLSFLVTTTSKSKLEILTETDIVLVGYESPFILSGTLRDWQSAVVICTQENKSFETRLLFDKIYLLLDRQGLSEIFATWNKRKLADQTFTLEPKE